MDQEVVWQRCYAHVDMVSYFASVEQLDFPELMGKPVCVTNSIKDHRGATIVAASPEAKRFGVKTGMRLAEAKSLCRDLIRRNSRIARYLELSEVVMNAIAEICDLQEVYSVDECFLELKPILHFYESPLALAQVLQSTVYDCSGGLRSSIGVSEGKLTAKYVGSLNKGQITVVPPSAIRETMARAKVADICGIGRRLERYLNDLGITHCGDLAKYPIDILAKPFGNIGRRIYMTCLGHDPELLRQIKPQRSMGHSQILPPGTERFYEVYGILCRLSEKLTARLRRHHKVAGVYSVGIRARSGWIEERFVAKPPHADTATVWRYAKRVVSAWVGQSAFQVRILATDLESIHQQQQDLFAQHIPHAQNAALNELQDAINAKFKDGSLQRAPVIAAQGVK